MARVMHCMSRLLPGRTEKREQTSYDAALFSSDGQQQGSNAAPNGCSKRQLETKMNQLTPVLAAFERLAALQDDEDDDDFDADLMQLDGLLQLCEEVGIEAPESDTALLSLAFHCRAGQMGQFTRSEFEAGLGALECRSLPDLAARLPALREKARFASPLFPELYAWVFTWACPPGQRTMPVELAAPLLELLIPAEAFPHVGQLCAFLKVSAEHKGVSKDCWAQLPAFVDVVAKGGLDKYDDEYPAWPVLIDDFVEYVQAQAKAEKKGR